MIKICVKAIPFSLGVLQKHVRVTRGGDEVMDTDLAGSLAPSCTKKQINRAMNKVRPVVLPILVVSSAGLFNFSYSGVGLGSP